LKFDTVKTLGFRIQNLNYFKQSSSSEHLNNQKIHLKKLKFRLMLHHISKTPVKNGPVTCLALKTKLLN